MKTGLIFLLTAVSFFLLCSYYLSEKNFNLLSLRNVADKNECREYPTDWAWIQRTFPFYKADHDAYRNALNKLHEMKQEQKLNKVFDVQWQFAGPENIGGRIVDIEFNSRNPDTVYAGAATGGVLRSTDKGQTWTQIFDDVAVFSVGDIAVDPVNPDIIFVGTGEANGGHNNFPGGGIYKSTDAGSTWEFKGLENSASIGRIVINPSNDQIIYLAAVGSYFSPTPERGVYKSTDGGNTWDQSLFVSDSTGAIDLVIDPANTSFLMASMWERVRRPNSSHLYGPSSGIYRTTNGGTSWEHLGPSTGLPNSNTQNVGRIGLVMSASNPNITCAIYTDGYYYTGLYKTTDYGDTWFNSDPNNQISFGTSNFSWYFGQIRIHPANPDIIYAMDVAFMRSTDGGNNWPIIYGYTGPPQLHVDHHALAFDPSNPNYLIEGNDGGINISTDGGVSWGNHANIAVTQFYEIGLDYNNPQKLYGGTQDNNTVRTQTGNLDDWESIYGGDGFYVIVDFTNPLIIYAESQNGGLGKSTNGGSTFNYALNGIDPSEKTNWSTPVVMDPNNHNILYYGTSRIYRTTDGADSWFPASPDLTDGTPGSRLGTVTTICVAPTNSNVIYAGTDDSHVWVTTDNGTNWSDISADLPYRWVTRVVVDPNNENNIYVTFSGLKWHDPQPHVFKSTDMGQNWVDISSNLPDAPINAFAVDYHDRNRLYLGNDIGAFVSFNGGNYWYVLGSNLPTVSVYDMKIHPTENYLAIGTHGRSMYKIDLNNLTAISNDVKNNLVGGYKLYQNYPNPFNPSTVINWRMETPGFVILKVFDILGHEIVTLVNEYKSAGSYSAVLNTKNKNLASGVYIFQLRAGNFIDSKKMVFAK